MTDDAEIDTILEDLFVATTGETSANLVLSKLIEAKQALIAWSERREAAARLDELIWATGGIAKYTDEGKGAIPNRIKQLTSDRTGGGEGET